MAVIFLMVLPAIALGLLTVGFIELNRWLSIPVPIHGDPKRHGNCPHCRARAAVRTRPNKRKAGTRAYCVVCETVWKA